MTDIINIITGACVGAFFIFGLPWLAAFACVAIGHGPGVCGL